MAKLSYTWYPKDWGNSEAVFELTLLERGLYRELIDIAMLNDNKTIVNIKIWARKFGSSIDEIESILFTLERLKLVELKKENLFIPSCETRLKLVRSGAKGGSKSKPTPKGNSKGSDKPTPKGKPNQKKDKVNIKEIESKIKNKEKFDLLIYWFGYREQIKKPIEVESTINSLINRFNKETLDKCKWVVNYTIENNYVGLFWNNYKIKNNNTNFDKLTF